MRFRAYQPVHVTLRVADDIRTLRRRELFRAIRWATITVAKLQDTFRIVHISIEPDHVHLICEADDYMALARGVQGFTGSATKHINLTLRRRGAVFPDRYHVRILKSPTSTRHAISYVLNNWRHHREDEKGEPALFDPYSSATSFFGWKELESETVWWPPDDRLLVFLPRTWLLREGWRRAGSISAFEVPGASA